MTAEAAPDPTAREPGEAPAPRRRRRSSRKTWIIALAAGVLAHGAALGFLRVPAARPAAAPPAGQRAHWMDLGAQSLMLNDRYALQDSEPLFLPTRWNYPIKDPAEVGAPGDLFEAYRERLTVDAEQRLPALLPPPRAIDTPAEALAEFRWPRFSEFGRVTEKPPAPSRRLAFVEIRSTATGQVVLTRELPAGAATVNAAWGDWKPFEMLVSVAPTGMSEPWLSSPAPAEIASFFAAEIRRSFPLALRFPEGFYRISVGP